MKPSSQLCGTEIVDERVGAMAVVLATIAYPDKVGSAALMNPGFAGTLQNSHAVVETRKTHHPHHHGKFAR